VFTIPVPKDHPKRAEWIKNYQIIGVASQSQKRLAKRYVKHIQENHCHENIEEE